jgi:hemoglobin
VNYHVSKTILGENPKFEYPKPIFLEEIGVDGLKKLFSEFYDLIVDSDIGNFFPQDEELLEEVKAHNVKFFVEAAGGPKEYSKKMGHFDMLKTHEQFSITEKARREWLGTMEEVLRKTDISDEAKQSFWDFLESFSKHTVNVDEKQDLEDLVVKKG